MELHLTAERGELLYLLSVGPNPGLGLSKTYIGDHTFPTLDALAEFIKEKCNAGEVDLEKLQSDLGKGKKFATPISKASALRMDFKF